ncbi:MAG: nitrate reductase associated protein [Cyanobacteriota bacterium]|nr:nitrate reductase associated protein [Cyanobacteriota bacterium]
MTNFFQFEDDFVTSLRCIPMIVRYKLDTCGVKLKLAHWNQFPQSDRQVLVEHPTTTPEEINRYRTLLQELAEKYTDLPLKDLPVEENLAWLDGQTIPETVLQKAQETDVKITLEQWQNITPLQRFALIKLSRPSHENQNFLPAVQEFNLV